MGIQLGGSQQSTPQPQLQGSLGQSSPTGGLNLRKVDTGERLSLVKGEEGNPNLDQLLAGLSWDVSQKPGEKFDLDLSLIEVDENDKTVIGNFVCYDKRYSQTQDGGVKYNGDNQTGQGEGYDETADISLSRISPNVKKIAIYVHIFDAVNRQQNFGRMSNASITLEDKQGVMKSLVYDLTEDYSTSTAIHVAEIYRHGDDWKLNPIGMGLKESLEDTLSKYGL